MGRMYIGPSDNPRATLIDDMGVAPQIIYVDRPVDRIVEVPVITTEVQFQERIVYQDRPVEVIREVEVPVVTTVYEIKRVEVPVERIVHVHDIDAILAERRASFQKNKKISTLTVALGVSVIVNLLFALAMMGT